MSIPDETKSDIALFIALLMVAQPPKVPPLMQDLWERQRTMMSKKYAFVVEDELQDIFRHKVNLYTEAAGGNELAQTIVDQFKDIGYE